MNFQEYFHNIYLEAFDNALNFLTDPANKDKTFKEVVADFEKNGGEMIGGGAAAAVFYHPSWNYVLKTFYADGCYVKFARIAERNSKMFIFPKFLGPPRKIIPSFIRHVSQDKIYAVRMEKLFTLYEKQQVDIFRDIAEPSMNIMLDAHRKGNPLSHDKLVSLSEGYEQVLRFLEGVYLLETSGLFTNDCRLDIHRENVMMRDNGEWVITDPTIAKLDTKTRKELENSNEAESLVYKHQFKQKKTGVINPVEGIVSGTAPLNRKQKRIKRNTLNN